jgi:hypothetical protein
MRRMRGSVLGDLIPARRTGISFALLAFALVFWVTPAGAATSIVADGPAVSVVVDAAGATASVEFDGVAGQRVSLEITGVTIGTSPCCSTKVSLVRPDGRTVTTINVGTTGGFLDATSLALTGTYSIVVDPQSTSTGEATLTLHEVPTDVSAAVVPDGSSVTVALTAPGQNASVTFDGVAGERVSLDISDVTIGTSFCCSTKVTLLRPDGKSLVSGQAGTNGGFIDAVVLPTSGTYTIALDPQGAATGSLVLLLHEVPANALATIVPGGPSVEVMMTVPGQNATVTFGGLAGQRVSLELSDVTVGTSTCCSTKVTFLRPDGKSLVTGQAGTNGGFVDAVVLPTSGTYTIALDPQGAATGSLTLLLNDVPPDATAVIVPGGAAVTVSTTIPGQNATVTFGGVAGQRVSLELIDVSIGTSTCCSARVSILKPNGATLVSALSFGNGGGFADAVVLPTTGTYTIVVDPQGPATGSATLVLHDVPPDVASAIVAGGAPVTVTATIPGQNARLTFSGTSGQRISVSIGPACCATRVSILKPNGATLVGPAGFGASGGFLDTVVLTSTGTHTVIIDLQGPGTGDVTITLHDVPADVTGSISFGDSRTVVTTVPGQNARLSFAGVAGQQMSLVVPSGCCAVAITVIRPSGSTLVGPVVLGAGGGFIDATVLPATGTYTIVIDPQGASTGGSTISLYSVPPEVTAAAAFGSPTTVATGVPGQNARFTFTGTVGQRISVKLGPSCCPTRMFLVSPSGSVLSSTSSFGSGEAFLDTKTLPEAGTYSVSVDPQGSVIGSFTITVYDVPGDATDTIAFGSSRTVAVAVPGQNARLTFDATAGQGASVEFTGVTIGTSPLGGTVTSIVAPDGTTLASRSIGTSGGFIDKTLLPATGTYTILLDPQGANTGGATVTLEEVPIDVTASIAFGTPLTVTTLASGQNAQVTFAGASGQRISLGVTGNCCFSQFSMRAPDGSTVVAPTTFGTGGGFIDARELAADGTYTILVDPQGAATGSVTLTLWDVPADASATISPGGSAVTITTTTPGQNARLTFAGTAGQRVSMRIAAGCCTSRYTLVDPDGVAVTAPVIVGAGGGFMDTATLPATGTYVITVDPQGAAVGATTVTLFDVPADVVGTAVVGGPSVTVSTTTPGQNAVVGFVGTAGDGIIVRLGPFNCCSTKASLVDPAGATIAGPVSFNPDGGPLNAHLSSSGTYSLVLDPQGAGSGDVHVRIEVDNAAPGAPVLVLSESSLDSHVIGTSFFYRPAGTGGGFSVSATASDTGTGLDRIAFPGLSGGFAPSTLFDDRIVPYSQSYTWTPGAAYSNSSNPVIAYDRVGNSATTAFAVTPDSEPPTTTDNTAAIGSGWKNTDVIVLLSPSDGAGSGSERTHYTIDGTTPTTSSPQGTSVTLTAEGAHTVKYFSIDNVQNAEPVKTAGTTIRIDKTRPSSAVLDPLPAVIRNGRVLSGSGSDALSGVASIAYFQCAGSACTPSTLIGSSSVGPSYTVVWNSQPVDGTYQVIARVSDAAGNTFDSAKRTVTIDNTAPNTTISAGPANPTSSTAASFSFASTETGSTFECQLDGGGYSGCTSAKSYSGLVAGSHTFQVRATDPVGNTDATPAAYTWTVDLTPPETTIDSKPSDPSNSASPVFAFSSSEVGSSFECQLDGGGYSPCTSTKSYSGLAAGSHTFQVRATDPAGNVDPTAASYTWTVDLVAPETTISAGPANPTSSTAASFSFASTEPGSTFECRLDGAAFAACTSPQGYSSLSEGSHTFQVRATDPAGNVDPTAASYTWVVDSIPPAAPVIQSPAEGSALGSGTFTLSGTAEPGSLVEIFEGSTSKGVAGTLSIGTWSRSLSGVPDGSHTYTAHATDAAGNVSPASNARTVVVDTTPPNTTIGNGPLGTTSSTTATFTFSADDAAATFQCSLDGSAFAACTSPRTFSGLGEGSHTFEVRAVDSSGNIDATPASRSWTVDVTPPVAPIIVSPPDGTVMNSASVTISGTAEPSTSVTVFDGAVPKGSATVAADGSWSKLLTAVADGSHPYTAKATDAGGNTSPASTAHTVVVDTTAPATTIDASPPISTTSTSATFAFSANESGATFLCQLDGGGYTACVSPVTYSGLTEGAHTFQVKAVDSAGNVDATPASHSWTIDVTAPETTIDSGPADGTTDMSATFVFSSSDPGSGFECSLDSASFTTCSSPETYTGLEPGSHTFAVRASDPAGNVDPSPATYSWAIT